MWVVNVNPESKEEKLQTQGFICDKIFFATGFSVFFPFLPSPFYWLKYLSLTKQSAVVDDTIILLYMVYSLSDTARNEGKHD